MKASGYLRGVRDGTGSKTSARSWHWESRRDKSEGSSSSGNAAWPAIGEDGQSEMETKKGDETPRREEEAKLQDKGTETKLQDEDDTGGALEKTGKETKLQDEKWKRNSKTRGGGRVRRHLETRRSRQSERTQKETELQIEGNEAQLQDKPRRRKEGET